MRCTARISGVCLIATSIAIGCSAPGPTPAGAQLGLRRQPACDIEPFEKALAGNMHVHDAYLGLAECYVKRQRYECALETAERARKLQDGDAVLIVMVDALMGLKDFDRAEDVVQELIARHPETAAYRFKRGLMELAMLKLEAAVDSFERSIDLDPDMLDARLELVKALAQLRQYDAAVGAVEQGLARERRAGRIGLPLALLLARVYEQMSRPQDARRVFDHILEKNPDNPEALAGLGRVLRVIGQVDSSLEHLISASRKHPKNASLLVELGLSYRGFGLEDQAVEVLHRAVEMDPSRADAVDPLLGLMRKHNVGRDAMFAVVSAAAKGLPDRFDMQMRFAKGLLARKKYEEALPPLKRAVGIQPSSVEANFTLGVVQARLGLSEAAFTTLDVLCMLDPAEAQRFSAVIGRKPGKARDGARSRDSAEIQGRTHEPRRKKKPGRRKTSRKGDKPALLRGVGSKRISRP